MSLNEAITHSKFIAENANWNLESAICISLGFTPGSIALSAYNLNFSGY